MATDDDDAATLRERVRELEQTVAQQQDTIEHLMPSRRAILAGGAGLVGGAALTGQASAQSAAGQVGTSSEPVDVEAATVSADSVNTEVLTNGIRSTFDQSLSGSGSSIDIVFNDLYTTVDIIIQGMNGGSGGTELRMTIDDVNATNYRHVLNDGTMVGSNASWLLCDSNLTATDTVGVIRLKQSYDNRPMYRSTLSNGAGIFSVRGQYLGDPGSPINKITISSTDTTINNITGYVIGRS